MASKNKLFSFFKKLGSTQNNVRPDIPDFDDDKISKKPIIEKQDATPKTSPKTTPIAKGISLLVGVYYLNNDDETEKRRITIRRLWQQNEEILIDAFCHETKAPRIFLLSRITKIVDLKTKRAFSNPTDFIFNQISPQNSPTPSKADNQTSSALGNVQNELTALVFLAQTDNEFSPIEKKVILDYIAKRNANINLNTNEISEYLDRLYPDEESFYDAIDSLLDKPENILTSFVETFIKLILSDGVIHDNEREFLAELLLVLKEEGIEIQTNM